jgi:hypothetical protein
LMKNPSVVDYLLIFAMISSATYAWTLFDEYGSPKVFLELKSCTHWSSVVIFYPK